MVRVALICLLLAGRFIVAEPAGDPPKPDPPEFIVDEVLLGRQLSLQVFARKTPAPMEDVARLPSDTKSAYVRFVLFDLEKRMAWGEWAQFAKGIRVHGIVRVVMAEWAQDQSLIILYVIGDDVCVSRIAFRGVRQPVESRQHLFRRGPLGGVVWEILRAELDESHPDRMTLNIMTRGYDGSHNVIPVHRDLGDPDGRWTYDRSVMGNVMYADQDTVWRRSEEDQRDDP